MYLYSSMHMGHFYPFSENVNIRGNVSTNSIPTGGAIYLYEAVVVCAREKHIPFDFLSKRSFLSFSYLQKVVFCRKPNDTILFIYFILNSFGREFGLLKVCSTRSSMVSAAALMLAAIWMYALWC